MDCALNSNPCLHLDSLADFDKLVRFAVAAESGNLDMAVNLELGVVPLDVMGLLMAAPMVFLFPMMLAPSFLSASQLVERQLFLPVCTDILFQLQ